MQLLHWAKTSLYISVPVLLILLFVAREILLHKLKNYYFLYYVVLFPGVVLHETSHLLGCLITGAKIGDIEFFSKNGGHVMHSKPRLKYVGTFLISIFPLAIGASIVLILMPIIFSGATNLSAILLKIIIFYLLTTVVITMFPSSKDFSNASLAYILVIGISLAASYYLSGWIDFGNKILLFLLVCIGIIVLAILILTIASSLKPKKKSLNYKRRRL